MSEDPIHAKIEAVRQSIGRVIRGKDSAVELLLTAILAGGHILMDDIPGVGKTTMAKALAKTLDAKFKRVQFTPDLLPADILGSSIFNPKTAEFIFHEGPVFTNIFLADEINRASPRTQSALLEAMSENQVSSEGTLRPLPDPFIVIATENPIEYYGTYPLPEAQLDRFAMELHLGYPDPESERGMAEDRQSGDPLAQVQSCLTCAELTEAQKLAKAVGIEHSVSDFLYELIQATRTDKRIRLGASPRAYLSFSNCARARAWLNGRDCVTPEDIRVLAVPVLAHRLTLQLTVSNGEQSAESIVTELLKKLRIPA